MNQDNRKTGDYRCKLLVTSIEDISRRLGSMAYASERSNLSTTAKVLRKAQSILKSELKRLE